MNVTEERTSVDRVREGVLDFATAGSSRKKLLYTGNPHHPLLHLTNTP